MTSADPTFEGVYGTYSITAADRQEVRSYRIALLITGLSLAAGVLQWWQTDNPWGWLWMLPMATALGLALRWIHIYLRPLHRALQLFWLGGCVGWGALLLQAGPTEALSTLRDQPLWIMAIGPLFAALAGIGFKEFFCFRRPEAVGLTLLLPVALLGRLLGLVGNGACGTLVLVAGLLLVMLAVRKFGMEAAADVGDKSVFAYLDAQREGAGS